MTDPSPSPTPSPASVPSAPPRPGGHRIRFLLVTWILLGAVFVGAGFIPEFERNFLAWLRTLVVLLGLVLTVVWFLVLSRLSWRVRVAGVLLGVAAWFSAPRFFQVDGTVSGTGLPNIVRRHAARTPAPSPPLANPPGSTPPAARNVPKLAGLQDVTQFLGNQRDGRVTNARLVPDWNSSAPPVERWRVPVGAGWSSFAVSGNLALTQEQHGDDELVTARSLQDGSLVWAHTNHTRFFEWQGGPGPRATPTVAGDRVFTFGGTGILDCLDLATGRLLWTHQVLQETQSPNLVWGVSASPLLVDDRVVVTGGAGSGPTVLAYRQSNGEPLWRSGTNGASYASPILATLASRRLILSVNAGTFTAHDPVDGSLRLSVPWGDGKRPVASQPVVVGTQRVFLSAGYALGCVLLEVQSNPNGQLTATEVWRGRTMKTQFNSAGLLGDHLYGLDDGFLACVEVATGRRVWKDGRYGSGQTLLVNDQVLIQSENGPVILAAARPDGFRELGRLEALSSKTWNHPTLAGRYLLFRNDQEAVAYEWTETASRQP
jgi:outer membrane protein assembly factor BamB